jgi:NADH dehydrogenase FAD-containing subunit
MAVHKPSVVVVGSGLGGVETAANLANHMDGEANIILVSESDELQLRPFFIYPAFSTIFKRRRMTHLPLAKNAARRGIEYQTWHVDEIDTDRQQLRGAGRTLDFDHLVIATGAGMRPSEIPGYAENSETFWGFDDALHMGTIVEEMVGKAKRGQRQRLLLNVAPNNKCAGPMYEIVFMVESYLRRKKVRDLFDITYTTAEEHYIQAFGPKLHEAAGRGFEKGGIDARTNYRVSKVEPHKAYYENGEEMEFDYMIGFPPYIAHTNFENLPTDERGFIHADKKTWQVQGQENIYVVGDGGDFPVKQAFLALGMAGVVSHNIVSQVKKKAANEVFDPVSMCIMEQFDAGMYAQVPLAVSPEDEGKVIMRPGADDDYVVRRSRLWQMGKWGMYMTMVWQMGRMETFHEGPIWSAMDLAIGGMQKIPAPA